MLKLSICFTVYNQSEMLKEKLEQIIEYKGDDIEIVVSDDCSTENIREIIESFQDKRIRYCKTEKNLGHDLNIIHGLRCCVANYVYLFRTRDNIYTKNISKIISFIEMYPEAGFFYFSALDETGQPRLNFKEHCYKKDIESFNGYIVIPTHPSGNLYNKKYLDLDLYEFYVKSYFSNIYGFIVHQMVKYDLSVKADIITSDIIGWIYTDTLKAKDIAVNKAGSGINVYAPEFCYPRYKCEFEFIKNEIPESVRFKYLVDIVHENYISIIYRSPLRLNDERYTKHYDSVRTKVNRKKELIKINQFTEELLIGLPEQQKKLIHKCMKIDNFKLRTFYPVLGYLRNLFLNTKLYTVFRKVLSNKKR